MSTPRDRLDPIASLLKQAELRPDAIALEILGTGELLSYAELVTRSECMKARLVREGVTAGDFVLVMLPSGAALVATIYALMSLSAVAVPVHRTLTDFELSPILRDACPVGVITDGSCKSRALVREALSLRFIVDVEESIGDSRLPLTVPAGDPHVTCHFTYKGFGYPLGALHRYGDYAVNLAAAAACYDFEAGTNHLCVLPQYPVYGLSCTLTPLAHGCRVLVATQSDNLDLLSVLRERQVRIVSVVPLLYRSLVQSAKAWRKSHGPLGLNPALEIACGGSFLSDELAEEGAAVLGFPPYQGYGLSETLLVTTNRSSSHRRGTLGKSMHPELQIAIVDARGEAVTSGRVGEIVVSGPTVTSGYVRRPRETAKHLRDGRFFTGDLGHFDREGFLCFDGRSQSFTKAGSQMVDLTEIERVLALHPAVAQAVAIVSSEPRTGERISASVICHRGATTDARALKRHCAQYLSAHKIPRSFELLQRELKSVTRVSA